MSYNTKMDFSYNNQDLSKVLQAGTAPYKIQIENKGFEEGKIGKTKIDFNII